MPIANLLGRRLPLAAAIVWTTAIAYLSLLSFKNLGSEMDMPNADKLVHIVFHFGFTILWFWHFKTRFSSVGKTLAAIFIASFIYGIGIELAQEFLTADREADVADIIANISGSFLAVILSIFIVRRKRA